MDQTLFPQSKVCQLYAKLPFTDVLSGKISTFLQRNKYFSSAFLFFCPETIKLFKSLNEFEREPYSIILSRVPLRSPDIGNNCLIFHL